MGKDLDDKLSEFGQSYSDENEFNMDFINENKKRLKKIYNEKYLKLHNIDMTRKLLDCSKRDLDAFEILYEKGDQYANSIYHLQQSVEKLLKSWGLKSGKITPSDLRGKISHDSSKVMEIWIEKWIDDLEEDETLLSFFNMIPSIEKPRLSKDINEIYEMDKDSIRNLSSEEIKNFLDSSSEIDFFELIEKLEDHINHIKLDFRKKRSLEITKVISKDKINFFKMYTLSKITYLHNFSTRYPDGDPKPEDYNKKDLGIVKEAPFIKENLLECISDFEKCLNFLEKIQNNK